MTPVAKPVPSIFTTDTSRPLQQGDVFVQGGFSRIAASDGWSPTAWAPYESYRHTFAAADTAVGTPAHDVVAGLALVMVVSHDCHLDKELHLAAKALLRAHPDRGEEWAYAQAETDDTLDRHVIVSPIVSADAVAVNDSKMLLASRVVGYLAVPPSDRHGLIETTIVDLGQRTTVDRLTLTRRLASLGDEARLQLRYALARMDSLRTPDLTAELEAAVGQRIMSIDRPTGRRATLLIAFEDGGTLEVLPRPGHTPQDGPRRQAVPDPRS